MWESYPIGIFPSSHRIVSVVCNAVIEQTAPLYVSTVFAVLRFVLPHPAGKYVFWHSTAHILGEAMERVYGGCLCYGPPIEEGFYYDMHLQDGQVRHG